MSNKIRTIAVAAVAAVACLGTATSAMATPTIVRNTGWVPLNVPGAPNSDCSMISQLVNDPATGSVYSRGSAWCANAKMSIMVTQTMKRTTPSGVINSWDSMPTPLTNGARWVFSPYSFFNGCYSWQGITKVTVTDRNNRSTYNYATTGSPKRFTDHCPY